MRRSRTRAKTNASAAVGVVLSNVSRQLLDVAHGELSEKALHELRIACRRAEAALRLCQDAADGRAWRWLKRRLKLLRRTCNAARDDDVLEQWIQQHKTSSSKSLRQAIRAHRAQLQPQIVELAQRLSDQHRFERRSKKVIKQLRACELRGQIARAFGRRLFVGARRLRKRTPDRAARSLTQKAQETAIRLQRKFWRWWQALPIERMLADTTAEVLTLMSKTA